jgi:hypothetical protein
MVYEDGFLPHGFQVVVGHSHMCVSTRECPLGKKVCFVNLHLPHTSRPVTDLQAAVQSVGQTCTPLRDAGYMFFCFGDFNHCLNSTTGTRGLHLNAFLQQLDLLSYSSCLVGTRTPEGKRLDSLAIDSKAV